MTELFIKPNYRQNSTFLFVHLPINTEYAKGVLQIDGNNEAIGAQFKYNTDGIRIDPITRFEYEFPATGFLLNGLNYYFCFLLPDSIDFMSNSSIVPEYWEFVIKNAEKKLELVIPFSSVALSLRNEICATFQHNPFAVFVTVGLSKKNAIINSIVPESYLSEGCKINHARAGFKKTDICASFFNFGVSNEGKRKSVITYSETAEELSLSSTEILKQEKLFVFTESYIPPVVFSRKLQLDTTIQSDGKYCQDDDNKLWKVNGISNIHHLLAISNRKAKGENNVITPAQEINFAAEIADDPFSLPMALYFVARVSESKQLNNSLHFLLEKKIGYTDPAQNKSILFTGSMPLFSGLKEPVNVFGTKITLHRAVTRVPAQNLNIKGNNPDYFEEPDDIDNDSSDDDGLVLQKSAAAYIIVNNDVLMPLKIMAKLNNPGNDLESISINNFRGDTKPVSKSMQEAGKTALIIGHRGLGSNKVHDDTDVELSNGSSTNLTTHSNNNSILMSDSPSAGSASLSISSSSSQFQKVSHKRSVPIAENNIDAYNLALNKGGCDMIELDVILTKDNVPVINHNFMVDSHGLAIPIPVLTEKEFKSIQISRTIENKKIDELNRARFTDIVLSGRQRSNSYADKEKNTEFLTSVGCDINKIKPEDRKNSDCPPDEVASYPLLTITKRGSSGRPSFEDVLKYTDQRLGINVELKYPSRVSPVFGVYPVRFLLLTKIFEIISKLYDKNQNRTIYFSSFDWRIVGMLRLMQNKYPVFLLHCGVGGIEFKQYDDTDSNDITVHNANLGLSLAKNMNMHGMVLSRPVFDTMSELVEKIRNANMKAFTYGTISSDKKSSLEQVKKGVEGIIIDLVLSRQ